MKTRIMTVDLEPDLRSDQCQSMELVVPKLLNFFDDYNIKATFFTVTSLLEKYEDQIKEIAQKHEIASHSHYHNWRDLKAVGNEIRISKEKLEEYGFKCLGYRAPALVTSKNHFQLLKEYGYKYDSSLATFYPGRYKNFKLPQKPFVKEGITEFPVPTVIYPAIDSGLSYLKLFYPLSKLFPQKYLFYIHPWEFMTHKDVQKLLWNPLYLLTRNSGKKAWHIFKNYIRKEESRWISCKGWIKLYPQAFP